MRSEDKIDGRRITRRMQMLMILTASVGVVIVQIFMAFITGDTSMFKENALVFSEIIFLSIVVVAISMFFHAWYIKVSLKEAAQFLDSPRQKKNETEENYHKRIAKALLCTIDFPFKGAGLSIITWPAVLTVVMTSIWIFFFRFPFELTAALVTGALCAGALVTNIQFYVFKKYLLDAQRLMMSHYPSYWKDPGFGEVRMSMRRKMVISLVSLMVMVVVMGSVLSDMEGAKGLFLQWGQGQKARIMREMKMLDISMKETTSPGKLARIMETLDDGSGARFMLFDSQGNNLLPSHAAGSMDEIIGSALAREDHRIQNHSLLVPLPGDKDVFLSVESLNLGVNARIAVPGTGMSIIARADYAEFLPRLTRMIVASAVVLMVALAVGIFFARVSSSDITDPLGNIVDVFKKVSSGDLRKDVDFVSNDEVGVLSVNFKAMIENIRLMILKIKGASQRVEDSTFKIVKGFSDINDGSQNQSKMVDETSASVNEMDSSIKGIGKNMETLLKTTEDSGSSIMEMSGNIREVADSVDILNQSVEETTSSIGEMTASIGQVAENIESLSIKAESTVGSVNLMENSIKEVQTGAMETAQMSETVARHADEGKAQVQSTIDGVGRARRSSELAVTAIQELAVRAEEIGDILTVINDVTDRTNLLALNAAIIAAQAGERGRGFSVVADEIKNLAEQTSERTGEISRLIVAVQNGAKEAVEAVQKGYEVVQEGVGLSEKAGKALEKIIDSSSMSVQRAHDIANSTVDQADRMREVLQFFNEISENIGQLAISTNEQTKGSNQIMGSAQQMSDITRHVKKATQEQLVGSRQIIEAIENINEFIEFMNKSQAEHVENSHRIVKAIIEIRKIADENEKATEQVFQESANLSSLAEELRDMVGAFTLKEDTSAES